MRAVRIVLVSSPGDQAAVHWSHAYAVELGRRLVEARAAVIWMASGRIGEQLPGSPAGIEQRFPPPLPRLPLHRAADDNSDVQMEALLARALREQPTAAVVHVGIGARGTPNVAWLAERMGSVPFAVARAAEVVCHRGDLIERGGAPCSDPLLPERCRTCCSTTWWRTPRSDELQSRADLLVGSLLVADAVFLAQADEAELLRRFGGNAQSFVVGLDAASVAARILAALR